MATHFSDAEIEGLEPELVSRLDRARGFAKVPFIITEGRAKGGSHVANSAHARGLAVDIRCGGSVDRMKIVSALLLAGFTRIGVYDKHVHADVDPDLPQGVMWWGRSS